MEEKEVYDSGNFNSGSTNGSFNSGTYKGMQPKRNEFNEKKEIQNDGEKAPIWLKIICFLIPLVGLIMFCVNIKTKKKYAKGCGISALIGFVLAFVISIIMIVVSGFLVYKNTNDMLLTGISDTETEMFNARFEDYGGALRGSQVQVLVLTVVSSNEDSDYIVSMYLDGKKIEDESEISNSKLYNVSRSYLNGRVNRIDITTVK